MDGSGSSHKSANNDGIDSKQQNKAMTQNKLCWVFGHFFTF